jgi:hypothetical protein
MRAASPKCDWIGAEEAFKSFATYVGRTESAGHIKPLHWYIASRLVLEGGFHPDEIMPHPPFIARTRRGRTLLSYDPSVGDASEQTLLGGLKTKSVDVVVSKGGIGPVMAISCKGVTKAFRNLTNRMEETIGECTNLHITYPALVLGYFVVVRANRTIEDAKEAPILEPEEDASAALEGNEEPVVSSDETQFAANDIAILPTGTPVEGLNRFHAALSEMTLRRGIRDEISRYEAISLVLVEPRGDQAGNVIPSFPPDDSLVHARHFFQTLYQRYEERFVYGAPRLASITRRLSWAPESPAFAEASNAVLRNVGYEFRRAN